MASTESTGVQQQKTAKEIQDAKAMPPPPVPVKSVLLEPELNALQDSLKNAVAQTGLVYKYYAKTFKPELRHVQAPQSLTGALGRELEKYDQVCDAMEAHILRAISILQRDLVMEEERLEEEHAALKAKEQEAKTPESMQEEDTSTQPMTQPTTTNNSPISGTHSARRPSAISISSLHRPAFPHKLDLSSVSFRMPTDENAIQSGLGSPVTLAPKSARPTGANDLPDFIFPSGSDSASRPPDVDLTIPDIMPSTSVDLSAGGSSDKPIELDLEDELDVNVAMSKFYGVDPSSSTANHEDSESIFPADMVGGGGSTAGNELKELKDADFFKQLEGLSTLQPGEESKATTSQGATALGNFNSDAANVENNLSNLHDQNFNFDTVIDLTGDDIDLTNLDSADFFSSSNQPNPEVNFSVDFTMGEPSEDAKEGVSNSNS